MENTLNPPILYISRRAGICNIYVLNLVYRMEPNVYVLRLPHFVLYSGSLYILLDLILNLNYFLLYKL